MTDHKKKFNVKSFYWENENFQENFYYFIYYKKNTQNFPIIHSVINF